MSNPPTWGPGRPRRSPVQRGGLKGVEEATNYVCIFNISLKVPFNFKNFTKFYAIGHGMFIRASTELLFSRHHLNYVHKYIKYKLRC